MQAIVLFAHGSRDPLWRRPMEAVGAHIARHHPDKLVRCAYLELCAPDLSSTAAELAALGAHAMRIVPMFLGTGRHAREDLPHLVQALAQSHPGIAFELAPPIGEDERLIALMAQIAAESGHTPRQ